MHKSPIYALMLHNTVVTQVLFHLELRLIVFSSSLLSPDDISFTFKISKAQNRFLLISQCSWIKIKLEILDLPLKVLTQLKACFNIIHAISQVRYDETANTYNSASSMGNSKSLYGHAMTPESNGSASIDNDLNHVETLPRGTEFRNSKNDDGQPAEKRQRLSEVGIGERRDANGPSIVHIKLEDNNNAQDKGNQAVFRNPAEIVTPRRKQRPRPEPLTIPPSASTTYFPNRPGSPMNRSQPCSPPYTPPPMLSPRSIYHVPSLGNLTPRLSASLQHPLTPSRLLLSGHRSKP